MIKIWKSLKSSHSMDSVFYYWGPKKKNLLRFSTGEYGVIPNIAYDISIENVLISFLDEIISSKPAIKVFEEALRANSYAGNCCYFPEFKAYKSNLLPFIVHNKIDVEIHSPIAAILRVKEWDPEKFRKIISKIKKINPGVITFDWDSINDLFVDIYGAQSPNLHGLSDIEKYKIIRAGNVFDKCGNELSYSLNSKSVLDINNLCPNAVAKLDSSIPELWTVGDDDIIFDGDYQAYSNELYFKQEEMDKFEKEILAELSGAEKTKTNDHNIDITNAIE